ncbi:polysaccharide biosynthesis/export family protein [Roseivirga sp. BDSF3-8]|uniref:polysaccharide biosynthesis/export family protein n=1 Tax=Roseivirga sp. BDSF3-8 TaxID=3241598 RepID=UPI003531ED8E
MNKRIIRISGLLLLAFNLLSCSAYKQHIMFRTAEDFPSGKVGMAVAEAERTYRIRPYDRLTVEVFTNSGERIIDPNFELYETGENGEHRLLEYTVQENGMVRLPVVGELEVGGYTLFQADSLLKVAYSEYFVEPFVISNYVNKRVIVLGGSGGQVIPVVNQNTSVIEVLAMAGGIPMYNKAHNIRLIRGDLDDPIVQVIDLSTIEGMKSASLSVMPGDIIYVEQMARPGESIRDVAPLLSIITSVLSLTVVLLRNN